MVARAVSAGRGVAGLVSYLMHDQVSPEDPRPETSERVAWAATVGGSPTDDVALNVRIMQGVTADAAVLKQLAGVSNRGRKLQNPYAHFVTSWQSGEAVSREQMLDVTNRQLKALGCADHLAVVIAHKDTDHPHCHLVVCKVHPETGRAAPLKQSGLKLSQVAEQWEREHGGIVIENRVKRREAREAFTAAVSREMAGFEADRTASPREQRAQRHAARDRAQTAARQQHPLPPMERHRGAGLKLRPVSEKVRWNRVYRAHRAAGTPPAEARQTRITVSALHRACRATPALETARPCRVDAEVRPERQRPLRAPEALPAARSCRADTEARPMEQPGAADDQHRLVELERQRAAAVRAEEAQREAVAERKRRIEVLASFPGAHAAAHEQFDRLEPGWRESGGVTATTSAQVLERIEAQVDKSLDKQEADLKTRLREWSAGDPNLLERARTAVLGSGQSQPTDRQERAQVLNAADRLNIAEVAVWQVRHEVEDQREITPSHRSLQAAAEAVAKDDSLHWGRDITGAIVSGRVCPGYADPGHEGETEQIRARIQALDEESAAKDAEAARQKADHEHAMALKAHEQLSIFRRAVTSKPQRRKPKTPEPKPPRWADRIQSYRDSIARISERAIRRVLRHFQPQLDPERRSEIFQNEMRSQYQLRQQPAQNRSQNQDLLR